MSKTVVKKFRLDLSKYEVTEPNRNRAKDEPDTMQVTYPLRSNFSTWLRLAGMFRTAEDVAEAVCLAKTIRNCSDNFIDLDEKEAAILKQVLDKLISLTADGRLGAAIGGELHEEAICRVVNMEEIVEE